MPRAPSSTTSSSTPTSIRRSPTPCAIRLRLKSASPREILHRPRLLKVGAGGTAKSAQVQFGDAVVELAQRQAERLRRARLLPFAACSAAWISPPSVAATAASRGLHWRCRLRSWPAQSAAWPGSRPALPPAALRLGDQRVFHRRIVDALGLGQQHTRSGRCRADGYCPARDRRPDLPSPRATGHLRRCARFSWSRKCLTRCLMSSARSRKPAAGSGSR